MRPLIDGDILRYEIGFAAEAAIRATSADPDALPSWDYVEECFHRRLEEIETKVGATEPSTIYITEGETFRDQIAITKPYKGTRKPNKPWHYNNLTVYMKDVLNAEVCKGIEADDAMAIEHVANNKRVANDKTGKVASTIICTRDKDLRQVPGWAYSWELGRQPEFGPVCIDKTGYLTLSDNHKKCGGTGLSFFYAQCLMGDSTDNIPGLSGVGPNAAFNLLNGLDIDQMLEIVKEEYSNHHGTYWKTHLTEQGRLLWMVRSMTPENTPVLWEIGMTE